jgi:hypothetical protein
MEQRAEREGRDPGIMEDWNDGRMGENLSSRCKLEIEKCQVKNGKDA